LRKTVVIESVADAAERAERPLLEEVARFHYTEPATFAIKLAVEEAINNAIKHGNKFDPRKVVKFSYDVGPQRTVVMVADQGDGFDPDALDDPTLDENLEKPTGRGVMLMHAYMDEVQYNAKGNRVRMVKRNG
jgi:serine/threonine-protein kinase RsbW